MTSYKHHVLGSKGEEAAHLFLIKQGMFLLQKNYYCHHGEIDLIMQDGDDIVFVEVRLRHNPNFGNALESVSASKIKKLLKTATHFLQMKNCLYKVNSRFDIIAFHPINGKMNLEWIKNAFTVPENL